MSYEFGTDFEINFPRKTFINPSFEKLKRKDHLCINFENDADFEKEVDLDSIKLILRKAKKDAFSSIKKLGVTGLKMS